jgi:fumarylacetoacetase
MVLLNDWSARDIQKWEYVPLGPFLAKVLHHQYHLDCYYGCIGAFRVPSPKQDPSPLPYAKKGKHSFDIHLAAIQPENAEPTVITTNFKYIGP